VAVAQLVEPWIVIPVVVGSSPISHPKIKDLHKICRSFTFYIVPLSIPPFFFQIYKVQTKKPKLPFPLVREITTWAFPFQS
jgi:hypothetical protein